MLNRSERLVGEVKKGNPFVGPNTYVISSPRDYRQEATPFRFKLGHRTLGKFICNPAPNQYTIQYRKHRIIGGSSLRFTEARKSRKLDTTGPSPTTHRIFEPWSKPEGNIIRGRPPRYGCRFLSLNSSYKIPDGNPKFKKKRISFYIRESYINKDFAHCDKYSGPRWSMSKSSTGRYTIPESQTPSPADYFIGGKGPTPQNLWDCQVRQEIVRRAKLNRFVMPVEHSTGPIDEDLPGPFDTFFGYKSFDTKSFNVKGTFGKEERMKPPACTDDPSPQSFNVKSTFGVTCLENRKRPPFNTTSSRPGIKSHPVGPADYNPAYGTIGFNSCKKLPLITARFTAPFGNTEARTFPVCGCDLPSPLDYDSRPPKKIRFCEEPLGLMHSTCPRFPNLKSDTPSCVRYNPRRKDVCDHAKIRHAFNSTSKRKFEIDAPDYNAAPNSYFASKDGVLQNQPRTIIAPNVGESMRCKNPTPGPNQYKIHPLYGDALIAAYTTHNVSFDQKDVFNTHPDPGPRLPKKVLQYFVRSAATKKLHQTCK